jgi:ubiquinone/menaquinone biosynthesis C-methylase UbiE
VREVAELAASSPAPQLDREARPESHRPLSDAWQSSRVARVVDAEGTHLAAILRAADFRDQRVLEVGSGEGRLTWGFAPLAASVLAFDPDEDVVTTARSECTEELRQKVLFKVAKAEEIDVPPHSVDLVFFSWSL